MIFLDAQTKQGERVTVFAELLEEILEGYSQWVKENGVKADDVWYSDVFRGSDKIATLSLYDDGTIVASKADGSYDNPFARGVYNND